MLCEKKLATLTNGPLDFQIRALFKYKGNGQIDLNNRAEKTAEFLYSLCYIGHRENPHYLMWNMLWNDIKLNT